MSANQSVIIAGIGTPVQRLVSTGRPLMVSTRPRQNALRLPRTAMSWILAGLICQTIRLFPFKNAVDLTLEVTIRRQLRCKSRPP